MAERYGKFKKIKAYGSGTDNIDQELTILVNPDNTRTPYCVSEHLPLKRGDCPEIKPLFQHIRNARMVITSHNIYYKELDHKNASTGKRSFSSYG